MTYVAETWGPTSQANNKLAAAQIEDGSGPGEGTSAGYEITDWHWKETEKDLEEGRRDGGETNLTEDSAR